jgi:GNAT superfamily N-acetyltransferase
MDVRPLRASDDRSRFHSEDPDLDRFFHRYAGQNQFRHHLGVTHVIVDAARILGFVTVAAGHVEIDDVTGATIRGLPLYPLPVLRLARLATDITARGRGIGAALLRHVFTLALRMADEYGCVGVVVDAKPGAVRYYEKLIPP